MGFASPPSPSAAYGMVAFGFVTTLSRSHRFFNRRSKKLGFSRSRCKYFVEKITQCDRVYTIAFGEGAQHLHLHLIPRFIANPSTKGWSVADHYRSVDSGESSPVSEEQLQDFVVNARQIKGTLLNYS